MNIQEIFDSETDSLDYYFDQPGIAPGTLSIKEDASPSQIFLIDYTESETFRTELQKPEDCSPYLDKQSVSWIDIQGLGSEDTLRKIGDVFSLHALVLEDIVNVPQRPKVEVYDDQLLIVTRMSPSDQKKKITFQSKSVLSLKRNHC